MGIAKQVKVIYFQKPL